MTIIDSTKPQAHRLLQNREQILRAQEMVLESYADQFNGGETYTTDEVESMMNRIIETR